MEYFFLQMQRHLKSHAKNRHIKKENWYHFAFVFKVGENNYCYPVVQGNAIILNVSVSSTDIHNKMI